MATKDQQPESISLKQFNLLLGEYQTLVESLSTSKGSKPGQRSLAELDKFRYVEATSIFSTQKPKRPMNHDDVKTLVDWKLRHGKFRPTLMKLVSSNEEDTVKQTIEEAMKGYWGNTNTSAALDGITKLKGIGPATASLLLSVHDPERVIFFSDEAFYWLCCNGKKSTIKYNSKEYQELNKSAATVVKRLGVSATDVEKVAYVIMKQEDTAASSKAAQQASASAKPEKALPTKQPPKRKQETMEEAHNTEPTRRSKRGKGAV